MIFYYPWWIGAKVHRITLGIRARPGHYSLLPCAHTGFTDVYWWFFPFTVLRPSNHYSLLSSNLYSNGIRARWPIIHTCLQQKSTCNLGFLLLHLRIYTLSAQLHRIKKVINRTWSPFSLVLKSHMKGKTIILYPSFCVHARLCPINTLPRFIPSQRLLVVVLLQQCNSHLTPFLSIF